MKKHISVAIFAMVLVFAVGASAYADTVAYVSKNSMNIYANKDGGKRVGSLSRNTVVSIISQSDGVAKIEYKGKTGYAKLSNLTEINDSAEKAVVNTSSRLYKKASAKSKWTALKKGTRVNVLSTSGSWALVERNGVIGYTKPGHLSTSGAEENDGSSADRDGAASSPAETIVDSFTAWVTADSLAVYKSDSKSSKKLGTLKKGAAVVVTAYDDTWARVQKSGSTGFCLRSGLSRDRGANDANAPVEPAPAGGGSASSGNSSSWSLDRAIASGKYSNQEIIFQFLTNKMKLNEAAACGILANIRSESSFNPTAYNPNGGSYGICQWLGTRYTRLKVYCVENGHDYTKLAGQLHFMEYELEQYYSSTLENIRKVDNSASGAYDAAYYWCYYYEVPANRSTVSVNRGNYAKETYWPKYSA